LEGLLEDPFGGVVAALQDSLDRNRIPAGNLAAVATVGGGASIPLITERLSERIRVPVVTTLRPQLNAGDGAAVLAVRGPAADAPTGMAAATDAATGMATAAWAAGAAGLAAGESASDGGQSATFRALAWSEDDSAGGEVVPYAGADYEYKAGAAGARPAMEFLQGEEPEEPQPEPLPWYRRPQLLFGAAATLLVLAVAGLAVTLTSKGSPLNTPKTSTPAPSPGNPSPGAPPAPGQTVTVTQPGNPGAPPPSPATPSAPPPATTTQPPVTTTTTTQPTTTTTTTTYTATTTTTPPTTTTTPPTTTAPTTTVAPPSTSRVTVPTSP
jgi:hypothetical protein